MRFYLSNGDGKTYGPYEVSELKSFASQGRIRSGCHLCAEGSTQWLPAARVIELPSDAVTPLSMTTHPPIAPSVPKGALGEPLFLSISVGRLIGMSIATFGIYRMYWMYRNWRYLKDRQVLECRPFWRAWFGVFYVSGLFKLIRAARVPGEREVASFSAGWLAAGFIVVTLLEWVMSRAKNSDGIVLVMLLNFASVLFIVPVQNYVNRLHDEMSPKPEPYPFSTGHIVCVVLGVLSWLLVLAGLLVK
jgi:GYF domain 2